MNILQFPDERLYKASEPITVFDTELKELAFKMLEITRGEKAVGLSAVQIGIHKAMFVMILKNTDYIICNPRIIKESGTQTVEEGCLSESGRYITKTRPMYILIEYQDIHGTKKKKSFSGLGSQCVAHEYRHLLGGRPLDD